MLPGGAQAMTWCRRPCTVPDMSPSPAPAGWLNPSPANNDLLRVVARMRRRLVQVLGKPPCPSLRPQREGGVSRSDQFALNYKARVLNCAGGRFPLRVARARHQCHAGRAELLKRTSGPRGQIRISAYRELALFSQATAGQDRCIPPPIRLSDRGRGQAPQTRGGFHQ